MAYRSTGRRDCSKLNEDLQKYPSVPRRTEENNVKLYKHLRNGAFAKTRLPLANACSADLLLLQICGRIRHPCYRIGAHFVVPGPICCLTGFTSLPLERPPGGNVNYLGAFVRTISLHRWTACPYADLRGVQNAILVLNLGILESVCQPRWPKWATRSAMQ